MNQPVDTFYINIYAAISTQSVQNIMNVCTQIVNEYKPKTLYFSLSSNGGEVGAGFTLYNYLTSLPVEIVMHNTGTVDSIATIIFLAATERYAAPHSTFLYHGVSFTVQGNFQFTLEQLTERLDSLAADQARIAEIISDKTTIDLEQAKAFQKQGKTITPSDAQRYGIISEVKDVSIPADAPIININM